MNCIRLQQIHADFWNIGRIFVRHLQLRGVRHAPCFREARPVTTSTGVKERSRERTRRMASEFLI
jgi:hypothetical protein